MKIRPSGRRKQWQRSYWQRQGKWVGGENLENGTKWEEVRMTKESGGRSDSDKGDECNGKREQWQGN
jgi:hypothetical protein